MCICASYGQFADHCTGRPNRGFQTVGQELKMACYKHNNMSEHTIMKLFHVFHLLDQKQKLYALWMLWMYCMCIVMYSNEQPMADRGVLTNCFKKHKKSPLFWWCYLWINCFIFKYNIKNLFLCWCFYFHWLKLSSEYSWLGV